MKDVVCFLCHNKGHMKSSCKLNKNKAQDKKPVGHVSQLVTDLVSHPLTDVDVGGSSFPLESFRDYLSEAVISKGGEEPGKAITALRDTGALQSLLVKSALPPSFVCLDKERVLVEGIAKTIVSCPLKTVFLNSELVKGPVKIAIVNGVPAKGVDMLLVNALAKGKVGTNPRLICQPGEEIITGSLAQKSSNVFPACVVTRSQA